MHKYMFTAVYKDGSYYVQNVDDVSIEDPEKSCFFDVKQEEVARFTLCGEGHAYCVDLTDGHFEIDGLPFKMHEEDLSDFRLIFFRQHTHHFTMDHEELSHDVVFRFGWQTTDAEDRNVQRVMEIK